MPDPDRGYPRVCADCRLPILTPAAPHRCERFVCPVCLSMLSRENFCAHCDVRYDRLPAGITVLPPQVAVSECQQCGHEAADDYTLHLPADGYMDQLRGMGWDVRDGRLLCSDCAAGRCQECKQVRGNPDCAECRE